MLVIAGPPGAGKTTVSRLVAAELSDPVCVVESDYWWTTVVKGFIAPWTAPAREQNRTIVRSFSAAAVTLAGGGYSVVLEGIVGPWNLDLVLAEAERFAVAVHYVVLRPSLDVALARAADRAGEERIPGHPALTDTEVVRKMWHEFDGLGVYERHVVDNTELDAAETATLICSLLEHGAMLTSGGA